MDIEEQYLVARLRQNARITLTALSRETGIPVSTLFDWMRALPAFGVKRLSALLDFPALGLRAQATLLLKTVKRDALRKHLLCAEAVNSLWRINNGYDFIAECAFKDLCELEEFCDVLKRNYGVKSVETHLVIEELKREAAFTTLPALREAKK
jgi:DNA-binding Lrp family transcriptional regulator